MTKESVARAPRSDSLRMTRSLKVSGPGDLAYHAGLGLGFLRFLGDFVITAAIPPATNVSKSISTFGSGGASGFFLRKRSSSVFRLAIGSSPRDAEPTSSDITRAAIILPSTVWRRSLFGEAANPVNPSVWPGLFLLTSQRKPRNRHCGLAEN